MSVSVLPAIREAVGPDVCLLADGGVCSALDVMRLIGLGGDFVYAVAAGGRSGVDHMLSTLETELRQNMIQVGYRRMADLPTFIDA